MILEQHRRVQLSNARDWIHAAISGARHGSAGTAFRPQDDQSRGLYLCAPSVHPAGTREAGRRRVGVGEPTQKVAPDGGQAARRG